MHEELNTLFKADSVAERALSYSRISDFDKNGPQALIRASEVNKTESVAIGSLVDDLTNDDIDIENKYYIYNGSKPTATLGKLCNIITKNYSELPEKKEILEIVKKNNFWSTTKDDIKLVSKYNVPEFWEYLRAIFFSKNKKIISSEKYELSKELCQILKSHDFSKHIFENNDLIDRYNQFTFNITYMDVVLRGMMDFLIVNHIDKTIQIIDLKTGQYKGLEFIINFIKFKYYIQESVYTLKKVEQFICKELNLKGYTMLPFQFLYISVYEKIPLVYTTTDLWHKAGRLGYYSGTYYNKGLDELIQEIKWHVNNNVYNLPKEIYINNGNVKLNDKFIKLK